MFCLYIFLGTLTALLPIYEPPEGYYLEPQQIAVLVISLIFGLFTWSMTLSHIRLVSLNMTTIEDIMFSRIAEHEATELDYAFGWADLKGKSQTRKRWVQEWGRLRREGNPWWLGSAGKKCVRLAFAACGSFADPTPIPPSWRAVFGDKWWIWLGKQSIDAK